MGYKYLKVQAYYGSVILFQNRMAIRIKITSATWRLWGVTLHDGCN